MNTRDLSTFIIVGVAVLVGLEAGVVGASIGVAVGVGIAVVFRLGFRVSAAPRSAGSSEGISADAPMPLRPSGTFFERITEHIEWIWMILCVIVLLSPLAVEGEIPDRS